MNGRTECYTRSRTLHALLRGGNRDGMPRQGLIRLTQELDESSLMSSVLVDSS